MIDAPAISMTVVPNGENVKSRVSANFQRTRPKLVGRMLAILANDSRELLEEIRRAMTAQDNPEILADFEEGVAEGNNSEVRKGTMAVKLVPLPDEGTFE